MGLVYEVFDLIIIYTMEFWCTIMSEEDMPVPDLPTLLMALEETMKEFNDMDDYGKITKRKLALNQELIYDAMIQIAHYVVTLGYKLDILDRLMARRTTAEMDDKTEDKEEPEEEEDEPKGDFYV